MTLVARGCTIGDHAPDLGPRATSTGRTYEGIVESLKDRSHGQVSGFDAIVRLETDETVAFSMRGTSVMGIVETGHRVRFMQPADRALVREVENLSTGALVTIWNPPRAQRFAAALGPTAAGLVLGAVLNALVRLATGAADTHGGHVVSVTSVATVAGAGATGFILVYAVPLYRRRSALASAADPVDAPSAWDLSSHLFATATFILTAALTTIGAAYVAYLATTRA